MGIRNAIIVSTKLGVETTDFQGNKVLTAWLDLDYGGSGQGFGGYALTLNDEKRIPESGANFILSCLNIADVTQWGDLIGKPIRVRFCDRFDLIQAIGHTIKDIWFSPHDMFSKE